MRMQFENPPIRSDSVTANRCLLGLGSRYSVTDRIGNEILTLLERKAVQPLLKIQAFSC